MIDDLDRIPPHSQEAEASVLGSMILSSEAADTVLAILQPAHFYSKANALIFEVIKSLHQTEKPVDGVTLAEKLKQLGQLEKVGGLAYLTDIMTSVPSAANAEYYARIVRDKAGLRKLLATASRVIESVYTSPDPVPQIAGEAISEVERIFEGEVVEEPPIAVAFEIVLEQIRLGKPAPCIKTGYGDWDHHIGGLTLGETIVVGGLTSSGKTTLGLNLARHVALTAGIPTAYLTYEMRKIPLVSRLVAALTRTPSWTIKIGKVQDSQYGLIARIVGDVADKPLFIQEVFGLPLEDLLLRAKVSIRKKGIQFFILDHLHRTPCRQHFKDKRMEMGYIINTLTTFAASEQVAVLALAQLNREAYKAEKIGAEHLKESSDIEQMGDVVVLIQDEEQGSTMPIHTLGLRVAKNREGVAGGEFKFTWLREIGRLESRAEEEQVEGNKT